MLGKNAHGAFSVDARRYFVFEGVFSMPSEKTKKEREKKMKTRELDANGKPKFGMRDKLAYAAGDLGCNMSFSLKGTIQTFWLAYMMLETGLLAALLLVVQIWDAINDPLIGSMIDADKRKYKMGKFKTYIFIGSIGLLVAGALCFIPLPESIRMNVDDNVGYTIIKCALFILG